MCSILTIFLFSKILTIFVMSFSQVVSWHTYDHECTRETYCQLKRKVRVWRRRAEIVLAKTRWGVSADLAGRFPACPSTSWIIYLIGFCHPERRTTTMKFVRRYVDYKPLLSQWPRNLQQLRGPVFRRLLTCLTSMKVK